MRDVDLHRNGMLVPINGRFQLKVVGTFAAQPANRIQLKTSATLVAEFDPERELPLGAWCGILQIGARFRSFDGDQTTILKAKAQGCKFRRSAFTNGRPSKVAHPAPSHAVSFPIGCVVCEVRSRSRPMPASPHLNVDGNKRW